MKAEKKISIKVKSKTEQRIMEDPQVEMITEWNLQRILVALIVFLLVVVIPAYYFSHSDDSDVNNANAPTLVNETNTQPQDSVKEVVARQDQIKSSSEKKNPEQVSVTDTVQQPSLKKAVLSNTLSPQSESTTPPAKLATNSETKTAPAEVIVAKKVQPAKASTKSTDTDSLHPHITRAQLVQGVSKLEPFGQVELPLLVDSNQAQGITYFTEVNNMQGETVFHEWLKQGKIIYKRKINIGGQRWRFYTSKLFAYSSNGQWQVRVITEQGDILHQIDFSVENR